MKYNDYNSIDLYVDRNLDYYVNFNFGNKFGTNENLILYSNFKCYIRLNQNAPVVAKFTIDSDANQLSAGILSMHLTKNQTALLVSDTYYFDIVCTNKFNETQKLQTGVINVTPSYSY